MMGDRRHDFAQSSYLSAAVRRQFGAFLTIANPGQRWYAGAGADRIVVARDGEAWHAAFEALALDAAAVVMSAGDGAGIRWELRALRGLVESSRCFLLTEPFFGRETEWTHVHNACAAAGITVSPDSPGRSTVIGFDSDWRAMTLSVAALLPEDYAELLHAHVIDPFLRLKQRVQELEMKERLRLPKRRMRRNR